MNCVGCANNRFYSEPKIEQNKVKSVPDWGKSKVISLSKLRTNSSLQTAYDTGSEPNVELSLICERLLSKGMIPSLPQDSTFSSLQFLIQKYIYQSSYYIVKSNTIFRIQFPLYFC